MKVLVVSGFLGAGKTTFIEEMTKNVKKNFVILENEYGEVGIDGDLLKKDYDKVWEMTEGCICCSMKSNFANSVMTIANTVNPEVLLVEPTGVGMLSSVLANIKKVEYDRIGILEPVTIVDPSCIERYSKEFEDIFKDQIKNSKFIVISKVDNMTADDISDAVSSIKEINPDAEVYHGKYSAYNEKWWEHILENDWKEDAEMASSDEMSSSIDNIGFKNVSFGDLLEFESIMSAIMRGRFGKIIRAKGFLPINNKWGKFDIVGDRYTLTSIEEMKESKLILIGTGLKKDELAILFGQNRNPAVNI